MSIGTRSAPTDRSANGTAPTSWTGTGPQPRPLPTRTRHPRLIAGAVLLIVGFALTGALLVSRAGGTTPVLVTAGPIPAGHVITAEDLRMVAAGGSLRAIAATDLGTVVGQIAAVDLVEGQVLNRDMLNGATVPGPGQAVVGLALGPGFLPGDGLTVGDRVQAMTIASAGDGTPTAGEVGRLLAIGEVFALRADPASATDTLVTLLVPAETAARLLAHGAAGQVGLIKIPDEVSAR